MAFYQLILFILINAGLSTIISRSSLTEPIRKKITAKGKTNKFYYWFGLLINCVLCTGFWTAAPVYLFVFVLMPFLGLSVTVVAFMFIGSFTAYFLNRISNVG